MKLGIEHDDMKLTVEHCFHLSIIKYAITFLSGNSRKSFKFRILFFLDGLFVQVFCNSKTTIADSTESSLI